MKDLARKYRPHTLSGLVGQPVVVRTLENAIKKNSLHKAYLFAGQFGSGKTTVARILAAMENCDVSPGINPCGNCSICTAIFKGTHRDIKEIDAASEAGKVEQVRKIKEGAKMNPIDGCKTKYYILDECHRMSDQASDAMLKLIEEPPSNVRFILCTTDIHKLRPAIQSRCQTHNIRQIYWSQIAERLKEVAKAEKVTVEDGAINLCARLASGSMRNGLQNLEKLYSYGGEELTTENAELMFGDVSETLICSLFDHLTALPTKGGDTTAGLKVINKMMQTGASIDVILNSILEHLRNMVVILSSSKPFEFINVSQESERKLREQCAICKKHKKIKALFYIQRGLNEIKEAVDLNLSPEHCLQSWFVKSLIQFNDTNL